MNPRRVLLVALLLFASLTYLWGVQRDLPHAPDSDEIDFLLIVAQMGASGDPNPHWFGHPGSTFIYPFAIGLHGASAVSTGAPWFRAHPELANYILENRGTSILIGRLVSVGYAVLALWLICLVGDRAFGPPVGLIGGWFAVLSPLTFEHVDMARTDSAGLFFGFLATWALLRLLSEPSRRAHVVAGLALGFAIGTRFFLAGLGPLLVVVEAVLLTRAHTQAERTDVLRGGGIALACIAGGLILSSPFLFLEFGEVMKNLAHEARGAHPGADGLDFAGNLSWYFTTALPRSVPWPLLVLSAAGGVLALVRREVEPLLLLGFVVIFLGGISLATLHWGRWLIQILPTFALLAASALVFAVQWAVRRAGAGARAGQIALLVSVVAVSAVPAWNYVAFAGLQATSSTREIARDWILANLSPTERIAADLYTAPLSESPFEDTDFVFSLGEVAGHPAELRARGYDIAMVSSAVYRRFFATPKRYPAEIGFYRALFRKTELLKEFRPGPGGRGPVIRLYRLPDALP
ncbi:MAG: glycosyltransferase family 39 protein [Candidatus Binatia bacterium]|nr:glycosyltransferase family 39 protein [Candidatus Binatia bacterium]